MSPALVKLFAEIWATAALLTAISAKACLGLLRTPKGTKSVAQLLLVGTTLYMVFLFVQLIAHRRCATINETVNQKSHPKKGNWCPFPELHIRGHTIVSIHKCNTFAKKLRVWGQGWEGGAGFVPFPYQKGGMGVEVRDLVRISPFLLLLDRFRV